MEYIISQIKLQPGYVAGDYLGVNQMFSNQGSGEATQKINSNGDLVPIDEPDAYESDPMELWRVYQVSRSHGKSMALRESRDVSLHAHFMVEFGIDEKCTA